MKLPDYGAALALALEPIRALARTETIPFHEAAGRVLDASIIADRDLPPFDRAQMDGYALRASHFRPGTPIPVIGTVPAGAPGDIDVPPGECIAIATGAPLPADVDTVIQHELSDRGNPVSFTVESVEAGRAVHPRGADARRGDQLVAAGTVLGPPHVGIAATVGALHLTVRTRPTVVLLTSGDEVKPPDADVADHQIRNSNGPMLVPLLERLGAGPVRHAHLPDDERTTVDAVAEALDEADLLITVGGVSAGERDHFPAALDRCGVSISLRKAAIQPGKPIAVGHRGGRGAVTCLPGNPVSALVCCTLFAWPVIHRLLGLDPALPWRPAVLAADVKANPNRRAFRPACMGADGRATIPAWAGSGDLAHTAPTNGILELPVAATAEAGTTLRFLDWPR
ncbi:MAG: molybdopterin molybdotransferase MoeA [Planctomycetota bacterium]